MEVKCPKCKMILRVSGVVESIRCGGCRTTFQIKIPPEIVQTALDFPQSTEAERTGVKADLTNDAGNNELELESKTIPETTDSKQGEHL